MFVDLLGTEVDMATIRALVDGGRGVDLLFTWPEMDVVRNQGQLAAQEDRWTGFFGTDQWRAIARSGSFHRIQRLRDLYAAQVEALGYPHHNYVRGIANGRRRVVYRPLFLSRHSLGKKFWEIAATPSDTPRLFE